MADVIFVKHENGKIESIKGESEIHLFVLQELRKHEGLQAVRNAWERMGLLVPDRLRDMIMTRFFLSPTTAKDFLWFELLSDKSFARMIRDVTDYTTYMLFPMEPELDRQVESNYELGFGGALLRTLEHVPCRKKRYFINDWSMKSKI